MWDNNISHFPESPLINKAHRGSCDKWCKKIFSIAKSYIICESTSILEVFNRPINPHGLSILSKSKKRIKRRNDFSELIAFRVKILSNTLPTRKRLHSLYPDTYPNQSCPRCSLTTEDIIHLFKCQDATNEANKIILNINNILHPNHDNNPIKQIWQVVELACGITSNIFSTADENLWIEASIEALNLLYNDIWKPRCNTANTYEPTGIKWKTPANRAPNPPKKKRKTVNIRSSSNKNSSSSNTSKSHSSSSNSDKIELTKVVIKFYLKNECIYSKCLTDLFNNFLSPSTSFLSR
jgi:hypothetical protein